MFMKVDLLSSDVNLLTELRKRDKGMFEEINTIQSLAQSENEVLVISDKYVSFDQLTYVSLESAYKVFYLLSNQVHPQLERTVKAICESKDIFLIAPRLTVSQIVDQIEENINPVLNKSTNVVSFFSTIDNVGKTSTVLSVAKAIQTYSKTKVGVLLLDAWDDGTDQLNYQESYLDEVKHKLSGNFFETDNEFLSCFHMLEKDSLYILAGNKNTKMERLFTKDEISFLIEKSKEVFDLVLIDAGSHFDNANMVQALKESTLNYLIVNQQQKAIKKFDQIYKNILLPLGYSKESFLLIVNQYEDLSHFPSTKNIYDQLKIPLISTIEKTKYGIQSEQDQKILYCYDDLTYKESINLIGKSVVSIIDVVLEITEPKKRKKLFSFN